MIVNTRQLKSSVQNFPSFSAHRPQSLSLFQRGGPLMPKKYENLMRLFSLSRVIAILLVVLVPVTFVGVVEADRPSELQTDKVSPLLKGNKYRADETVTVIVTLNGSRSGRLNAFLNQAGIHQRREMKNLRSFS